MKSVLGVLLFVSAIALAQLNPVPFINQPLVPTSTSPGGPAFTLTVNGTGFVSGAVVNWNGAGLTTTFVNSSQVTAIVPASDTPTATVASVTVTNPAPGGGTSDAQFFDVLAAEASLTFTDVPSPTTTDGGSWVISADFNGDGKPDLAYTDGNSLVVQLGNGDGTFKSPVRYAVGNNAFQLIAADFNNDGKLDLAVVNVSNNTVSVLLGNGDGTFQPQQTFPTGGYPEALIAGDFNGDGKLDLAVACTGQNDVGSGISVLLGNGDGTFQAYVQYGTSTDPYAIVTGDFNRNGTLDLVVLWYDMSENAELSMLEGNGDGSFQAPVNITTFQVGIGGGGPDFVLSADLNGDNKLDLVVVGGGGNPHRDDDAATVLLGNGDGTFQSPVVYLNQFGGIDSGIGAAVLGDFSADGKLDFAYALSQDINGLPGSLTILPGNGDGTFQTGINFPGGFGDLAAGDFNGDGKIDFVTGIDFSYIPLFLQGQYPLVGLSTTNLNAPNPVNVGSSEQMQPSLTVTNTGTATLAISQVSISGANAQDFGQTNNCIGNLAPNATCQVNATFSPVELGSLSATLRLFDDALDSPTQAVGLSGTAVAPVVSLSPQSVNFPGQYVGTSGLPQTVTVTNTGTATLTITNVTTSIADFGSLSNCTNPVPPNANCTIGVFFDPTTSGTRSGNLIITDNASGSPQTVPLTGTGQDFALSAPSPSQTVSPGQTATYSVTVEPEGGFKQTVQLSCTGAPAQSSCSVTPSSVTLNGTASQPVTVTVAPVRSSAGLTKPWFKPPSGNAYGSWMWWLGTVGLVGVLSLTNRRRERRRRWVYGVALVCVLAIGMTLSGCGGGSSGGGGTGGIQAGTYNLTLTGTFTSGSNTLTHNAKLTLIVN
jgi:VCBS repeat protein/centrosomal CEP192-like protein/HYDIN/CFA65/VesB family protein